MPEPTLRVGMAWKPLELTMMTTTTMKSTTYKSLKSGQAFHWDASDAAVEPPKVKISDTLYLDPTANGCKHPIRVQGPIEGLEVFVTEGETVRVG
jgi:hypothetical protein